MTIINSISSPTPALVTTVDSTGNLAFQVAGTTALTLNAQQNANFSGSVNSVNTFGFKNRIINGSMQIWQRGTSFTNVSNGSLTNHYTADRWFNYRASYSSNLSVSQVSGFGGQQYALQFGRANGDSSTSAILLGHIIESVNMIDLQGKTVTLSFLAKTGANYSGGQLSVVLQTGTTADQGSSSFVSGWAGATTPISVTQTITSTATQYSFTGTIPSNALESIVYFVWSPTGTAGANDNIQITGVQLEVGTNATSFDYRPYGTELNLCYRYTFIDTNTSQPYRHFGSGYCTSSTNAAIDRQLPVPMRTTPSITASSQTAFIIELGGATTAITDAFSSPTIGRLSVTSSGLTTGYGTSLASDVNSTLRTITYSAEL